MPKDNALSPLTEKSIELIAARFHALGDGSRLKLIAAAKNCEKNVSQLVDATGLTQANVSKHLKILTDAGFLVRRREGIQVFYTVADATVFQLCKLVSVNLKKQFALQAKSFGQV